VAWGRLGESRHQYLTKGKLVAVDGELRQDRWQQDGQNRSKVEIVANNIQLLGGGSGGGGSSGGYSGGNNSHGSAPQQGQGGNAPAEDGFADDIPF
jgi:single-strand DNA-binding protein